MVAETRRRAHAKATFELNRANGSILKLPPELVRMIFEHFADEQHRFWLVWISTICKALMPEVEAALYRTVAVSSCKNATRLCRALVKRPYRALAVRSLVVYVTGGASIKQPLKSALPLLTSLKRLELTVDDPSIFPLLLDAPFRLRTLLTGGYYYPDCVEDILASQPSLQRFSLMFTPRREEPLDLEHARTILRPDILPNLRSLTGWVARFPLTLIKHPYPIVHLALVGATRRDITHAISLFGNTLVTLILIRLIDEQSPPECYWPTYMFRNAHLPKLECFTVADRYDEHADLPLERETMVIPGLREICPALKTIVWGADGTVIDDLQWDFDGMASRGWAMTVYARMLFDAIPTLERVSVYDDEVAASREVMGEVFTRAEDRTVKGPESASISLDEDMWTLRPET